MVWNQLESLPVYSYNTMVGIIQNLSNSLFFCVGWKVFSLVFLNLLDDRERYPDSEIRGKSYEKTLSNQLFTRTSGIV
jgi:hypothetical protein